MERPAARMTRHAANIIGDVKNVTGLKPRDLSKDRGRHGPREARERAQHQPNPRGAAHTHAGFFDTLLEQWIDPGRAWQKPPNRLLGIARIEALERIGQPAWVAAREIV